MWCLTGVTDCCADRKKCSRDCKVKIDVKDMTLFRACYDAYMKHSTDTGPDVITDLTQAETTFLLVFAGL